MSQGKCRDMLIGLSPKWKSKYFFPSFSEWADGWLVRLLDTSQTLDAAAAGVDY